jgi:hypothetical protein
MSVFNKLTRYSLLILSLSFCSLHAIIEDIGNNIFDQCCYEEPLECETFSYEARMIAMGTGKTDINKLSQDAVITCYNAHQQSFHYLVSQEQGKLHAQGLGKSSYFKQVPVTYAKSFAEKIINQLDILAQNLASHERNAFWSYSEQHIKNVLAGFCCGCDATSIGSLNAHIENLIKMKKIFG